MGKRLKRIYAIAFVLLYQLSFSSFASAGYFDWLGSNDQSQILTTPISNKLSRSSNIWDYIKGGISIRQEDTVKFQVVKKYSVLATGYSSTPDQTDESPFVTASGAYVREGIIAANFYVNGQRVPFGTMVRIPEVYGDRVFIVEDRMNIRYSNNIDIWFPNISLARDFGAKRVTVEIIEES